MTHQETTSLEKFIKDNNLRLIWTLIVCTAITVSTVLSIYYTNQNDKALLSRDIKEVSKDLMYLRERVQKLEDKNEK